VTAASVLGAALPAAATTRFAPAPTGRLHLGHLANAIFVWGLARRAGGRVLLRIEDHDRQRCRPEYETALLDDLERLAIAADEPSTNEFRRGPSSFRQSDNDATYRAAWGDLLARELVYACDCSRSTFDAWRSASGRAWSGPGCPGGCRDRHLLEAPGMTLRAALGDGEEPWIDVLRGPSSGPVTPAGDLPIRDRNGNWTYSLCVVVDDQRHGIDLVVRGEDLLDATPAQIRLGRLLGREGPPAFAHHPLVRKPDGTKLSKADGATGVGELLDAGRAVEELIGEAARATGLSPNDRPMTFVEALARVPSF
jgi:glutamyl/glutaminyl-tRNA synthetase